MFMTYEFTMMVSSIAGSIVGSGIAVMIMYFPFMRWLTLLRVRYRTYAKREYEPFLIPSPCKTATTASVMAVGLSLLFQ